MSIFSRNPKIFPRDDPFPWNILAQTDPPPLKSSEFWHVLPCSVSTVRDWKRSSVTVNKKPTRTFQRVVSQGSTPPLTASKCGSNIYVRRLSNNFDNKGRQVCCKVSLYKNCQRQNCNAINCLSSCINMLAGVAPFPWYMNANGTIPPNKSTCVVHTSPHSAAAVRDIPSVTSLCSAHWLASDFHSWINSWIDCQTNVYTIWLPIQQFNQLSNQQLDRLFV